jgi:hypothetical protein
MALQFDAISNLWQNFFNNSIQKPPAKVLWRAVSNDNPGF